MCGVVHDLDTPFALHVSLHFTFGVLDVVDACVRCATCAVNPPPCCSLFPSPQAVRTAVTDLYARHVNQVAEDKTVPSDTRPAVSDAEMEKEFGRQVGGPHLIESLYRLKPPAPCVRGGGGACVSTENQQPVLHKHGVRAPHTQRISPSRSPTTCMCGVNHSTSEHSLFCARPVLKHM
jgi:hypothetical protein